MDTLESRIVQSCDQIDMRKVAGIAKIARYGQGFESIDWDISYCDEENPALGIKFTVESIKSETNSHILIVKFWSTGWCIEEIRMFEPVGEKRRCNNEGMVYNTDNKFLFTSHLTKAIKRFLDHLNKY